MYSLRPSIWAACLMIAAALVLEGCRTPRDAGRESDGATDGVRRADVVSVDSGSLRSATGCRIGYSVHRRGQDSRPVDVVLSHGFLRDRGRMAGLAHALAEAGMPTVTLDLCNMKPWDGAHQANADDMRAIARRLAGPRPVYAGFSAGALAAILAARADPSARGVLALDLVDRERVGEEAARALSQPVFGVIGEASSCNADNNGLAALAAAQQAELVRISGATHCDFESPTDALCRLVCEPLDRSRRTASRIQALVIEIAVSAARRLVGHGAESSTGGAPGRPSSPESRGRLDPEAPEPIATGRAE